MDPRIDNLNNDVTGEILKRLDPESRNALGSASSKMHGQHKAWVDKNVNALVKELLDKEYASIQEDFPRSKNCFKAIATRYSNCSELLLERDHPLEGWDFIRDEHLDVLVGKLPHLKSFALSLQDRRDIKITANELKVLFESCKELTEVRLPEELVDIALKSYLESRKISVTLD
jgi:adenylate kinase family enzyme